MIKVRGSDVALGTVLFVPVRSDVLRFGNIVDQDGGRIALSFSQSGSTRRPEAEWFDEALVLRAIDIEPEVVDGWVTDKRYVFFVDRSHVKVLQVLQADAAGSKLLFAPVAYDNVEPVIPDGIDVDKVYAPVYFATLWQWRFKQPVDPLVDVVQTDVGMRETFREPATLRLATINVPVSATVEIDEYSVRFGIDAHYQISNLISSVAPKELHDELLEPEDPGSPWRAGVVVVGSGSSMGPAHTGSIDLKPRRVVIRERDGVVQVTRETYRGAPWSAWNAPMLYREPLPNPFLIRIGAWPPPDSVQFQWRGSRVIIYRPPFEKQPPEESAHLAVVYMGEPLSGADKSVLNTFIGYCTGGRAVNVSTETFDVNDRLGIELHHPGDETTRRSAPLPIDQVGPYIAPYVLQWLPDLLNAMMAMRERHQRSFDAAFHHYAEGVESSYPVTRTLRLAVAFEAFVNLVTLDFAEDEAILDKNFKSVRDELLITLKTQKKPVGPLSEVQHGRLVTKIQNMNRASNTKRQKAFWNAVPIKHTAEDDDLLKRLRNESVHRGYVGDEQTREGLQLASADANRLTDLFNRSVLTYAGYRGPVLSAGDGSWLDALTGESFKVPPLPPNQTIEITSTVNAPAFTSDEKIAYDALSANQRKTSDPHFTIDIAAAPPRWENQQQSELH